MKEDRILRCGNNDPWGYSSMCAALGLLETHLGSKTSDEAKAASAERFISLHYKLLAYQVSQPSSQQQPADAPTPPMASDPINRAKVCRPGSYTRIYFNSPVSSLSPPSCLNPMPSWDNPLCIIGTGFPCPCRGCFPRRHRTRASCLCQTRITTSICSEPISTICGEIGQVPTSHNDMSHVTDTP
jgi:hypothetical protein